ncbi:MAG TPA: ribosome biogenesis GTPase Der [Thermodesulfobacteriota bacterium]|nr:ribosome biogenesis GTPase Der [Thermodesulfobacteriota bacterium]
MKPIIAIVGRPNVGKSTLFNRLAGRRKAIVEDEPGVTRDRNYAEAVYEDHSFILIDTGGFEPAAKDRIQQQIREQVEVAIREADLILFVMDGKEGLNPTDIDITGYLRQVTKPVFYAVNKIDGERHEGGILDFYRLGVPALYSVSAAHGRGIGELMDEMLKTFPPALPEEEKKEEEVRVALVGRPNVGKSSFLNSLIGRSRAIVDSTPGTTRDAIDTPLLREGRKYIFIDTAGIRRKSKVTQPLEKYSAIKALKSLERCDVALVLLDGFEGLTEQDARIAEFAEENGRAMILVVNKWDLVQKDTSTLEGYKKRIGREMKTLDYVPILFISALTGQRVSKIFTIIDQVIAEHRKRISTAELNNWLQEAVESYPPPLYRNHRVKLYYISQVSVAPPTFILFTNEPQGLGETYRRYLLRRLREKYGFTGTPLRLFLKERRKDSPLTP